MKRFACRNVLNQFAQAVAMLGHGCDDAVDVIACKRGRNGLWRREAALPGKEFFVMEAPRGPSRWTTLMALRVLKAYGGSC